MLIPLVSILEGIIILVSYKICPFERKLKKNQFFQLVLTIICSKDTLSELKIATAQKVNRIQRLLPFENYKDQSSPH